MSDYDRGYDNGWRYGTFDKCNGRERVRIVPNNLFDKGWEDGYNDAYDSNDARIAA